MTAWGVYVHVPWCRVRCPYCAFHVDRDDGAIPWDRYLDALDRDWQDQRDRFEGPPDTIYLGGGTPSRMPPDVLASLLTVLDAGRVTELTVEANPEDVSPGWLDGVVQAGVSRISLGVQTLSTPHARRLGRAHTPPEAHRAMSMVADRLPTWSADLMFALPGQSVDDLHADLDALLDHAPPHISLYGLTWEPGTPFGQAADRGRMTPPDDDHWRTLMEVLLERLAAAGLGRYEISNFARPGHEAVHNRGYWTGRSWMGLGPSAHGQHPDGTIRVEVSDTAAWLDGAPAHLERPDPRERAADALVAGLRGVDGVPHAVLAPLGLQVEARTLASLVRAGLLVDDPTRMTLTAEGFFVADGVVRALVRALEPMSPSALDPAPTRR